MGVVTVVRSEKQSLYDVTSGPGTSTMVEENEPVEGSPSKSGLRRVTGTSGKGG